MKKRNRRRNRRLSFALATFLIGATPFTTMGSVTAYAVESQAIAEISEILPGRLSVKSAYYREIGAPYTVESTQTGSAAETVVQVHAGDILAEASARADSVPARAASAVGDVANTPVYDSEELAGLIAERGAREQAWTKTVLTSSYNVRDELRRAAFRGELSALAAVAQMEAGGLDNVLPAGALLTSDAFDGYTVRYNGSETFRVAEGVNEIDVEITVNSTAAKKSVVNVDLFSPQLSYRADSDLLSSTGGLAVNARRGTVWRTKLFVVGAPNYANEVAEAGRTGQPLVHRRVLKAKNGMELTKDGRPLTQEEIYANFLKAIREAEEEARQQESGRSPRGTRAAERPQNNGGNDGGSTPIPDSGKRTVNPWSRAMQEDETAPTRTILVYLNGSDLESVGGYASKDLNEMLEALEAYAGTGIQLLLLTGGTKEWQTDDIGAENQLWEIADGELKQLNDDFLSGSYMAEAETLAAFIRWAAENRESDLYDLILWDHGAGPLGYGDDEIAAKDEKTSTMSLQTLRDALEAGGVLFDFIGFDACLMGNAEVAFALEAYADYLVAAEDLESGAGWDYSAWLSALIENPGMGTEALAKIIADTCAKSAGEEASTVSVVNLTKMQELKAAVDALGDALYEEILNLPLGGPNDADLLDDQDGTLYGNYFKLLLARADTETFSSLGSGYYSSDLIDLGAFCLILQEKVFTGTNAHQQQGSAACRTILDLLGATYDEDEKTWTYDGKNGLSIYFPYYGIYRSTESGTMTTNGEISYPERWRIMELLDAYQLDGDESAAPASWIRAVAAFALRQITGTLVGERWEETDDEVTLNAIMELLRDKESETGAVAAASGLSDSQLQAIVEKQIREQIRAGNITITANPTSDTDTTPASYTVKVDGTNANVLRRMDVKISYQPSSDPGTAENISLGRMMVTEDGEEENGAISYTVAPHNGQWYTVGYSIDSDVADYTASGVSLDYQVASFYYTGTGDDEEGRQYYTGVIPVCLWYDVSQIGKENYYLQDAYRDHAIGIYLIQVKFAADDDGFSSTGTVLGVRRFGDNETERGLSELEKSAGYELLGNAEGLLTTGEMDDHVVSIGMVKTDENGQLIIKLQTVAADDLSASYTLVDAYGVDYELANVDDDNAINTIVVDDATGDVVYLNATYDDSGEMVQKGNSDKAVDVVNYLTENETPHDGIDLPRGGVSAADTDDATEISSQTSSECAEAQAAESTDERIEASADDPSVASVEAPQNEKGEAALTQDGERQEEAQTGAAADDQHDSDETAAAVADDERHAAGTDQQAQDAEEAPAGTVAAESGESTVAGAVAPVAESPVDDALTEPTAETPVAEVAETSAEDSGSQDDGSSQDNGGDVEIVQADAKTEAPSDPAPVPVEEAPAA